MVDLSSLGVGTSAVWTRAAALRLLSSSHLDRRLRTEWQSPYPGVLADAGFDLDAVQWAFAGVLASGREGQPHATGAPDESGCLRIALRAAACGRDAARVWGSPLIDDDDPATGAHDRFEHDVLTWHLTRDLTAPLVGEAARPHVLHRRELRLFAGDLVQHTSGLWLTSPLATALHCCSLLTFEAAVCVMDDGLHRELFTESELQRALDLRRGRPGHARQREVAAAADGRAEAASETLLRLLLKPHWPELEPQVTVYDERGHPLRRYDLGDRALKLGAEADGKRGHAGERMVAKDQRKDRRAGSYGWSTERASWFELRREQRQLRARILGTRDRLRTRAA